MTRADDVSLSGTARPAVSGTALTGYPARGAVVAEDLGRSEMTAPSVAAPSPTGSPQGRTDWYPDYDEF